MRIVEQPAIWHAAKHGPEHVVDFAMYLYPRAKCLVVGVQPGPSQFLRNVGKTHSSFSKPQPICIVHAVVQRLVKEPVLFNHPATEEQCRLANEAGFLQALEIPLL